MTIGTCAALIGAYMDGLIPLDVSLADAWGCTQAATVTLRGACIHEHIKQNRYCAEHGVIDSDDAIWLCMACAELGHDCPLTVQVVPDAA